MRTRGILRSNKHKSKSKSSKEITRIIEEEIISKNKEEYIPLSRNCEYLHQFRHYTQPKDGEIFCYCETISHYEMIACDNSSCLIEWFHMN
mmetsp:Transcript_34538/g.39981  ORF Transcript_34538/g.39981 Transcript_34538/m.39981 type:complete len:91 (+) Transcript_34538:772-1044(+)